MNVDPSRWEQGSEFHWVEPRCSDDASVTYPWFADGRFTGSGRDALRLLLRHGKHNRGWRSVLVPSFLCQEVVAAIVGEGLELKLYVDDPRTNIAVEDQDSADVTLMVNTFGTRSPCEAKTPPGSTLIEDHTHDPWSEWAVSSRADYCIASLRKTLPIADGGVLWSPKGLPLPVSPALTQGHHLAAAMKLEAMLLKRLYLEGRRVPKATFRALATRGESSLTASELSGIHPVSASIIEGFDASAWRSRRRANFRYLASALADRPAFTILQPTSPHSCPFSLVLVLEDSAARNQVREGLIEMGIFPAVLWPLEKPVLELPRESVELSRRVLSIHCDGRYSEPDLDRVADAILDLSRRK